MGIHRLKSLVAERQQDTPHNAPRQAPIPAGSTLLIDGSGWCYDADWDRMQRCAEMDVPVDWNGVGAAPAPPWFGVEERGLLVAVLLSGAVLTLRR